MNKKNSLIALVVATGLSACGNGQMASRNMPVEAPIAGHSAIDYVVKALRVAVPDGLSVSESNRYYPIADIVWRGDAYGNRHEQISAIVFEGMRQGLAELEGSQQVIVEVEITRFHSLTHRARYTVGGTHSIKFNLTVRDADSGLIVDGPRHVSADLKAFGGTRAVAEERSGNTQRVRIVNHLAEVIQQELGVTAVDYAVLTDSPS